MGLWKKMRERSAARDTKAGAKAYDKAIAAGASEKEATAAAEKAARRSRRLRIAAASAGHG